MSCPVRLRGSFVARRPQLAVRAVAPRPRGSFDVQPRGTLSYACCPRVRSGASDWVLPSGRSVCRPRTRRDCPQRS